jgi:hypothetical protein
LPQAARAVDATTAAAMATAIRDIFSGCIDCLLFETESL